MNSETLTSKDKPSNYIRVTINILKIRNKGAIDLIYNIVEIEK